MVPGLKGLDYGGETGEVEADDSGGKKKSFRCGLSCSKMSKGLSAIPWNSFFRADHSERTRGHSKKMGKEKIQVGCQETLLFSKSGESMEWTERECDIGRYSGNVQEKYWRN